MQMVFPCRSCQVSLSSADRTTLNTEARRAAG